MTNDYDGDRRTDINVIKYDWWEWLTLRAGAAFRGFGLSLTAQRFTGGQRLCEAEKFRRGGMTELGSISAEETDGVKDDCRASLITVIGARDHYYTRACTHTHTHTHTPCHHFQVVEHSQIICRIKQQANSLYISHASVWYESQIRWQEEERSPLNRCAWARVVRWGVWRLLGESKNSDFFSGCFSRGGLWADQWLSTGVLRLTGFGFTCLITALKMLSSSCLWTGSMFVCCQRTQTYTHTSFMILSLITGWWR